MPTRNPISQYDPDPLRPRPGALAIKILERKKIGITPPGPPEEPSGQQESMARGPRTALRDQSWPMLHDTQPASAADRADSYSTGTDHRSADEDYEYS